MVDAWIVEEPSLRDETTRNETHPLIETKRQTDHETNENSATEKRA
jgi:hypothetical protein